MTVSELRFAVPTADPAAAAALAGRVIGGFDVAGQVVDGAVVGAPGWILARTLGDTSDATVLAYDEVADAIGFLLPWARVHGALVEAFGTEVLVGPDLDLGNGQKVLDRGVLALGGEHRALAVLPDRVDYLLGAAAAGTQRDLVAARVGNAVLVTGAAPAEAGALFEDPSGGMYGVASLAGRSAAVVLWRRGATACLSLCRKGAILEQRLWEPSWTTIEPASLHRHDLHDFVANVVEELASGPTDGAELVKHLSLGSEDARDLRAALRRPRPDFAELLSVVGAPAVAADVFAGDLALTDLPQSRTFPATSIRRAVVSGMWETVRLPPDPATESPTRRRRRRR